MNQKNILALLFLLPTLIFSQTDNVDFTNTNWSSILQKSQGENKLIFLDAYTTWCGPCKKMDKVVFPNEQVAKFFNQNFINAKIDMEKGEGVDLAKEYGIAAFPSLLFIDGNGKAIHRGVGYHDAAQLLELAEAALGGTDNLSSYEDKFNSGNREPEFLLKYTMIKAELMNGSHLPIAESYLSTQTDWTSPEHLDFIYSLTTDTDTKLFDYLISNKQLFEDRFGSQVVEEKIRGLVFQEADPESDTPNFEKLDGLFKKVYPENAKRMSANYRMSYHRQKGDRANFALAAADYMKNNKDANSEELNDLAWTFFQVAEDPKQLKLASKWAKKAIKKDEQVYFFETLAALYQKMGKASKAIKVLNKGIALGVEKDEDASMLKEMLDGLSATN